MECANRQAWPDLPVFGAADASFANGLAIASAGLSRGILVDGAGDAVFLSIGKVMPRYSLYLHFTSLQGELKVWLEVAALYPQFAINLLLAAPDQTNLIELLEWLTCDWVDRLEGLLGLQLTLSNVETCRACEPNAHGVLISSHDGRHAHIAISGELLEYLHWPTIHRSFSKVPSLAELTVSVQAIINIAEVSPSEIMKLSCGMLLVLPLIPPVLVVVSGGKKQLKIRKAFTNGEVSMSSAYESYDQGEQVVSDEGRSSSLEQLSMSIDVVLDTLSMSIAELSLISPGQLITLGLPSIGRTVQLRCQGRRLAVGEIVAIEDQLAVMITSTDLQLLNQSL